MSRSTEGMDVTFLRTRDSLLLFLQSPRWNLERGKAYTVRLMAGSRSVEAKALAESKAVAIALADRSFNERLSTVDLLEVRGEGATLRVPLEGSTAALKRLDACLAGTTEQGSTLIHSCRLQVAQSATCDARAIGVDGELLFSDELGTGRYSDPPAFADLIR